MSVLISFDEYKIGNEEIDRQQYYLFELVNKIIQSNNEQAAIKHVNILFHYLADHFKTEEDIMKHYKYPSYEDHAKDHERLLKKLMEITVSIQSGELLPSDLVDFIRSCLLLHIFEKDMKLC